MVELDDRVWNAARFRRANPDYRLGMPFVYVGMTGLDPDVRFDKHKAGIQANGFVRDHGLRLLPALYAMYNPMPYEAAREMEVELGIALREPATASGRLKHPRVRLRRLPPKGGDTSGPAEPVPRYPWHLAAPVSCAGGHAIG